MPPVSLKVLFVFLALALDRRRTVHFSVTETPTANRMAQRIVETLPSDTAPKYLLRDGDAIYGDRVQRKLASLRFGEVVTAPASPWKIAYAERVIGLLRRELLDTLSCSTSGTFSAQNPRIWIVSIRGNRTGLWTRMHSIVVGYD